MRFFFSLIPSFAGGIFLIGSLILAGWIAEVLAGAL